MLHVGDIISNFDSQTDLYSKVKIDYFTEQSTGVVGLVIVKQSLYKYSYSP